MQHIKIPGKKKNETVNGTYNELLFTKEARNEVLNAANYVSSEIFVDAKKKA